MIVSRNKAYVICYICHIVNQKLFIDHWKALLDLQLNDKCYWKAQAMDGQLVSVYQSISLSVDHLTASIHQESIFLNRTNYYPHQWSIVTRAFDKGSLIWSDLARAAIQYMLFTTDLPILSYLNSSLVCVLEKGWSYRHR